MQEGVLSLMQMAKASAMLSQLAERRVGKLPLRYRLYKPIYFKKE